MEFNWSSVPNSSVNYDGSGSISNSQPGISGAHGTIAHDGNGMDLELVPYTQSQSGHAGQTLYTTSHYAGPELDMPPMEVYPGIFPTPEQAIPGGSDYGRFPNSSFSGVSYMEGLESTQNTGMMYGEYQETFFNTMNLDNNNNFHRFIVLPPSSSFNSNFPDVHGMDPMVPEGSPMHGYADIHAQSHNFGLDLHLDPTLTIPTSAMPNSMPIPALAPALSPLTPTGTVITTATPMAVDYDHNYGHEYDHDYNHDYNLDYDSNHDTPAPEIPEQETNTTASKKRSRNKKGNGKRVYRTSYDHHPSHRYTCHACRFSTDVKRDFFDRHVKTKKHKSKILRGQQREEQREEIRCARGQKQQEGEEDEDEDEEAIRRMR